MAGRFSDEYATLTDYILGITERIWEGRNVGLIRRYYDADCLVHTPSGPFRGAEAMVAGTLETLNAFPDRTLLGEDVIWSDDGPGRGLLSSHRILSNGTHLGFGAFGPPTGRPVRLRAIADCRVVGDVIVEEWLIRDFAWMARCAGLDPAELGRRLAEEDRAAGRAPWHLEAWEAVRRGEPEAHHVHQAHPAAVAARERMAALFERQELSVLRASHDRAVALHLPQGVQETGLEALDRFLFGYLAAFPDARIVVDHAIALEEPGRPLRTATRWRLAGTHTGRGAFGVPTGARVLVMGITHAEVVAGRVVREFWVVDEVAIHRMLQG